MTNQDDLNAILSIPSRFNTADSCCTSNEERATTPAVASDLEVADPIWAAIRREAREEEKRSSCMCHLLNRSILAHSTLEESLASILASKLATRDVCEERLTSLILQAFRSVPTIKSAIRQDLKAVVDRDPVAGGFLRPFAFFKGFQALQAYRVTHWNWVRGERFLAVYLQNRISEVYGVDIHPAAIIGCGILMDHATGIVIGETSVVEDNVSILHEVTLGGTGKQSGNRHPKVRQGVLLGAGAKILGNVEIGAGAKVGAGSVVLDPVPAHCTVAGVPARIVSRNEVNIPAIDMDQQFPHHFENGSGI